MPLSPACSQLLWVSVVLCSRCREPSLAISATSCGHRASKSDSTAATAAGNFGGHLLETVQAQIAENTVGRPQVGDAAIGQIDEGQRTLGFQARERFQLALVVQQQQAVGRQIGPAIVIHIESGQPFRACRQRVERHGFVPAEQAVAIEDARTVAVRDGQIHAVGIGDQIDGAASMAALHEREGGGVVAEAGFAVVARQRGVLRPAG
jgi:hypothetical protein